MNTREQIDGGCILLSRQIFENKIWYKSPEFLKIFIYIVGKVNFKDGYFKTGEALFNFSKETIPGCTKTQIYEFLRWAKSPQIEILTTQKTTRGVVVKLNNYRFYQDLTNYTYQDTYQDTPKTHPKHTQHYKKECKKERSITTSMYNNTHTNTKGVCVNLSKEEKEILVKYAKSNGARKVEPYINALIQNGGYLQILEDAKKKESTASQNTINTDLSKVHDLKTACAFIGKYGDFTDCHHPKEVQVIMKQYKIESYTHAVEIQRSM